MMHFAEEISAGWNIPLKFHKPVKKEASWRATHTLGSSPRGFFLGGMVWSALRGAGRL